MRILVLNCGSSSVKYQLFDMTSEKAIVKGSVEKIGQPNPAYSHHWGNESISGDVQAKDHDDALLHIRDQLLNPKRGGVKKTSDISAVGHRVVHGGERFVASIPITDDIEEIIEDHVALAPLHNPPNLSGIRAARRFFPNVPHVAVFDTAFHQTVPVYAYLYAIPYECYERDRIRRYGFHGTSHRYVSGRAAELLGKTEQGFTGITCHLGNGCSLAAVKNGQSIDTSMGFTPLEGVPMGTRSGDIDPAIIFHLVQQVGMSIEEIDRMLNRESGLVGVSGLSNDLREIQQAASAGHHRAQLAQEIYAYRVRKYIGAYLAVLGGADAVVFTGGVGENGSDMRARILTCLSGLGLVLDAKRNHACVGRESVISTTDSPIQILVIPTNEELLIARDTQAVVEGNFKLEIEN